MAKGVATPTFGTLLREYRLAAGLTQEALAERARLSAVGIGALERGDRRAPRFATLKLLADALELSPADRARLEAAARPANLLEVAAPKQPSESVARTNIPLLVSSFHGRDRDVAELSRLITERRLVTLCGAGGVGKMRLAIETARTIVQQDAERFPDGVWLAELARIADPDLMPAQIARILGVELQPSVSPIETLVAALRRAKLLLVLANCEHLVEAAAATAHRFVSECPALHILATSREKLRVPGERVEHVGPLRLPSVPGTGIDAPSMAELRLSPAVRLFLDRAADVAPAFSVRDDDLAARRALVTIAQRLEGIPLAIELAAARMSSLTLSSLAQCLDDLLRVLTAGNRTALPRQQTLRATIDWSYGLLSEPEQRLFERLSVFAGGWTLDAAESTCSDALVTQGDVPILLSSLVDKSLVVAETEPVKTEPRYRLLEMMREYARERLSQSPDDSDQLLRRHAEYYYGLVKEMVCAAGTTLPQWNAGVESALDELDADLDNCRGALMWALGDRGDRDLGSSLAAALSPIFYHLSLFAEGATWCERALSALGEQPPARIEATLQRDLSAFYWHLHGPERSYATAARAATLYRGLRDRAQLSNALARAAIALYFCGKRAEADCLAEEALALAREEAIPPLTIYALSVSAMTANPHDIATRRTLLDEALTLYHHNSTIRADLVAHVLTAYAQIAFEAGYLADARDAARRGIDLGGTSDSLAGFGRTRLAAYALIAGDAVEAEAAAREALASLPKTTRRRFIPGVQVLAAVAALHGDMTRAARLSGAVDAELAVLQRPRDVVEEAVNQYLLTLLNSRLGADELPRLKAEGAAWSAERAVEEALVVMAPESS